MSINKKEKKQLKITTLIIILSFLAGLLVFLISTAIWEKAHWDNLQIEELINQLAAPLTGTNEGLMKSFYLKCCIPGLITSASVFLLCRRFRDNKNIRKNILRAIKGGVFLLAGLVLYAFIVFNLSGFIISITTPSDYIEKNYAAPSEVEINFPERKRNLIYIWLESVETTYADKESGGAFDKNVIPELTQLAKENEDFSGSAEILNGAVAMYGSTWTMGAMFAHTSGLPLKIPVTDSSMSQQNTFFPGAENLGDILHKNGYTQGLLIGSDAVFGGRDLYFAQHGNYEIWDYKYSIEAGEIPEDYKVWWGYEDARLFEFAKEHLMQLAAGAEPFNLSILTVDTHFPDGYVCQDCSDDFGEDQYSNTMACSDRKVCDFVRWIQQQDFYENTTIVIIGDHLTMNVGYCDDVPSDYQRKVYTAFINSALKPQDSRYRKYSTMDMFPTVLASLGAEIKGDRLALGTNLFSDKKTLLERDGMEKFSSELRKHSEFMETLSGLSGEIYILQQKLSNVDTHLEIKGVGKNLRVSVSGLEELKDELENIIFTVEIIENDMRSTIWMNARLLGDDGCSRIDIPLSEIDGYESFIINIYTDTSLGRMKLGSGKEYESQIRLKNK